MKVDGIGVAPRRKQLRAISSAEVVKLANLTTHIARLTAKHALCVAVVASPVGGSATAGQHAAASAIVALDQLASTNAGVAVGISSVFTGASVFASAAAERTNDGSVGAFGARDPFEYGAWATNVVVACRTGRFRFVLKGCW